MDDKAFFRVLIESLGPEHSFFQTFWTSANHPGEAIDRILGACARLGIRNAIAREADYDFKPLRENAVRDKELNVFYAQERQSFPSEESFIAPFGIIKASQEGKYDYDLIQQGFSLTKTDAGIYEVEAVIERDRLFDTFIELVKQLPSIKVFWIRLAPDWEDKNREELWSNESLNTVESITGFLATHAKDTIANGHVALTIYSTIGQTNLLIDTHKTIKVLTRSAKIQRKMAAAMRKLGLKELSEFHSLEYGYYHFHYRPARSKSRTRLIAALTREGFSLWRDSLDYKKSS